MSKYYIRYEVIGGKGYYCIYEKRLLGVSHIFFERWNTPESALLRLNELKTNKQ